MIFKNISKENVNIESDDKITIKVDINTTIIRKGKNDEEYCNFRYRNNRK